MGQRVFVLTDWYRDGTLAEFTAVEARNFPPLPGDVDFTGLAASFAPSAANRRFPQVWSFFGSANRLLYIMTTMDLTR